MTNKEILIKRMDELQLTSEDVAELLSVSVWTVISWRAKKGNNMPDSMLELLHLKTSTQKKES